VIPPAQSGEFVAAMEQVLDVYKRPYDPRFPVVCMDESPKQLIRETRQAIPARPGQAERHDYEYERCGVCNLFLASEPLAGRRFVQVTQSKTKSDWARFLHALAASYPDAARITLVMDNLSTHTAGALYEVFAPAEAKRLRDRFEFVYTPKTGSWLNMAEIELQVLMGQCLNRRIDDIETVRSEVDAWQRRRNHSKAVVNWRFTTETARIKLRRLYPTFQE